MISFEGAFARYARDEVASGAQLLVVASNEASYGVSAAADQFIGMTRMRAAENGVDLVHGTITGSSVIVTEGGRLGPATELFTEDVTLGEVSLRVAGPTLFTRLGDWVAVLAMTSMATAVVWRSLQEAAGGSARPSPGFSENLEDL